MKKIASKLFILGCQRIILLSCVTQFQDMRATRGRKIIIGWNCQEVVPR